ncbi:MAG TPA: hypothetical protein VLW48_02760 [Candidatus Bathyarchaeia archaeon]|nr:hypothetical protein [Candidatus Bathyarchaeia archaeon]
MQTSNVLIEDEEAAPAITPEMLRSLKKEDMKQAVVERFKVVIKAPGSGKERKRSPYWQAADEEC